MTYLGRRPILNAMSKSPDGIIVTTESPYSESAQQLTAHLSADLGARYGDDGSGSFSPDDALTPGGAFVVAWLAGQAVGCGALRPLRQGVGEVKRMFVEPQARGRGVGRRILAELEAIAQNHGYEALWLETGIRQPEAIRLYEACGYRRISCYGKYVDNPLSVCFEKRLK